MIDSFVDTSILRRWSGSKLDLRPVPRAADDNRVELWPIVHRGVWLRVAVLGGLPG